ncbi:hypothetical protein [Joostella sp.]|uniref:hypothetical protein n=1 Tax=Joostella sp. TaxID=2231138 RepID=UPI003A91B73F
MRVGGYIQNGYIKGTALILIVYADGGKKWYRTGDNRRLYKVVDYFRSVPTFKYGKIFSYDKENKIVLNKIYWFNFQADGY